jgi:putative transposase
MPNLFQSLLVAIATGSTKEPLQQIYYLKLEVEILRGKLPPRITFTPAERRRLVRAAAKLGSMLRKLVTIVKPDTMLRWLREEKRGWKPAKRGRKRTPVDIQELVLMFAAVNGWGLTKILGELKKLGICSVSKSTVKRILRAGGFPTGPKRGVGTWDEFLKRHAVSLWQCDFLSRRVLTLSGFRDAFVLVFIHVKTRQVVVSPATLHPNDAWVAEQTTRFVQEARGRGLRVRRLQHDSDTKFAAGFRDSLDRARVKRIRNQFRAPNLNAFVERVIQSIQQECLDHFLIFGMKHFDYLNSEYLAYYHQDRPHQSLDNKTILRPPGGWPRKFVGRTPRSSLRCQQRLGGLLKSYSRRAA